MSEVHIELKDWHVVGMIATLLAAVFKEQIQGAFVTMIYIAETRRRKGTKVELLNASSGAWERVVIKDCVSPIPFVRTGGILIRHGEGEMEGCEEKISFANWKSTRNRVPRQ